MRGIAIYDDKIFAATSDAHLFAFDARTGKTVWETVIGDRSKGRLRREQRSDRRQGQGDSGPRRRARRTATRSASSAPTTPRPASRSGASTRSRSQGEPGGDTWGTLPNLFRAGAESWITGSYDPVLNLTYWGTAQAKPWMPISRGMSINDDALYTSSTLALDVDTGKLAWHFQHAPAEALDLDVVFERVLVDDNNQNLLFTVGKDGVLWKLDRKTGKYLGHKETVFQNVWESFDPQRPAGRTYRADILEQQVRRPGSRDARAPKAATTGPRRAYHAGTNQLIIPLSQSCLEISGQKVEKKGAAAAAAPRTVRAPPTSSLSPTPSYEVLLLKNCARRAGKALSTSSRLLHRPWQPTSRRGQRRTR